MRFSKAILSCGAMAMLACLGTAHAGAQQQFGNIAGGAFDFSSPTLGTGASGTPTTFTFATNATMGPLQFANDQVSGVLKLSFASASSYVNYGGGVFTESLSGVTESVTNGANTLVALKAPTTAELIGLGGGKVLFSLGGTNIFTSSYFTLTGKQTESLTLTTTSPVTASGFTATLDGGVFRSSSVPEASTLIGLGGLVLGGGFFGLRRRKA